MRSPAHDIAGHASSGTRRPRVGGTSRRSTSTRDRGRSPPVDSQRLSAVMQTCVSRARRKKTYKEDQLGRHGFFEPGERRTAHTADDGSPSRVRPSGGSSPALHSDRSVLLWRRPGLVRCRRGRSRIGSRWGRLRRRRVASRAQHLHLDQAERGRTEGEGMRAEAEEAREGGTREEVLRRSDGRRLRWALRSCGGLGSGVRERG